MTSARHLAALWVTDPRDAASRVRRALKQTDGNHTHAAALLGISYRTLCRWFNEKAELKGDRR
jgi:transcriptional regulator with PAS, ATPase and Fis domain